MKRRISYANITATLALVLALSAGAYAALKIPAHSVGTRQLKANAVNSAKVHPGSLLASDFKSGQLPNRAPIAYAKISSSGAVDGVNSRHVRIVDHSASEPTGFYCLDLSVRVHGLIASGDGATGNTLVEVGLTGAAPHTSTGCPDRSDAYVATVNPASGNLADRPFYVIFY